MSSLKKEVVALPIAFFDAQDELFIAPLREFLSSYGCDVVVNRLVARPVTYHIICGDAAFVKGILEGRAPPAQKRLVIMWQGELSDLPKDREFKTVLIDARALTKNTVEEIFSFFFTGRKELRSIRKEQDGAIPTLPQGSTRHEDESRIKKTVADIFRRAPKAKRKMYWTRWVAALAMLLILPWVVYGAFLVASSIALLAGGRMMVGGSGGAGRILSFAAASARAARRFFPLAGWQLRFVHANDAVATQEHLTGLLIDASSAARGVDEILRTGHALGSTLFSQDPTRESTTVASDLAQIRTQLGAVSDHLALSQAQLDRMIAAHALPFGGDAKKTIMEIRRFVVYLDEFLTLYPNMAGFAGSQTYLLLFQNSMELRPTGGFIGSVGVATFEDGRMNELTVSDVYTLDGQLKGHVDPPRVLRELMGAEHWYLRDSNWDPDFRNSASQAAWFYEKETGQKVDGVIGVSVPFVIDLLRATGPLDLTDFNDRVTADNFFGKSLLYTQTDFFPGSTQKKDFLGSLSSSLIRRITTERGAASGAVLEAMIKALEEKHVLFYFPDEELEALVSRYGWAGEADPLPQEGTDGISLVEANIGVNKANYFVTRDVFDQIALGEDDAASHLLTISYHNAATEEQSTGGGIYRSYLRLILPTDTYVETVSVNGISLKARDLTRPEAVTIPFAQLEPEASATATVLGVAFEVPPGGDTQVAVSYKHEGAIVWDDNGGSYTLGMRKQPGTDATNWQTHILYPQFWFPTGGSDPATQSFIANQGRLEYNTSLLRDTAVRVHFTK